MRGVSATTLSGALSFFALAWGGAGVARAETPMEAEVWYHADLDGRLATFRCGRTGAGTPDYAALVATISGARSEAATRGGPAPIVLLGGNFAAPDLFAATLLGQGTAGVRVLAALLARGGYDAVALGHHELSLEPAQLDTLLPELVAVGLPVVASNLRCDARRPACAAIRREIVVQRGGRGPRVGILAIISRSVLAGLPAGRMDGLTLEPPLDAIRAGVGRLRARGVTPILLMTQGPRGAGALDETDLLQRNLADGKGAAPDLVLAGGLGDDESGRSLRLLRRDGAPPVVGSPAATAGLTRVGLMAADDALVEMRASGDVEDPAARALLDQEQARTCATVMEPLSPAPTPAHGAIRRDEFARYVLEAMRRRAGAEIALINRDFVKRAPFPIAGPITRGDLHRALPYHAVLGAARVPGPLVESLLAAALGHAKLDVVGLARAGGVLEINGRPLDKARAYRVTTIAFVADGGDGILARHVLPWRPLDGAPDVRDVVEAFLRGGRAPTAARARAAAAAADPTADLTAPAAAAPIDPGAAFAPRADGRALWVVLADAGFDLSDTTVRNSSAYGDAQLTRAQQTSLKGQATLIAQLRHPSHEADARFDVQYGWSRNQPPGAPVVSAETADLVTSIVQYTYRGLRDLRRIPRPAIPDPYARAWLESELTRPELTATQPRGYRHLQLTNTVGAQLTLTPRLRLRGGAGVQSELLAPGDAGRWRPLLEAGATLDPTAIASWGPLAVKLDGSVSYDLVDPWTQATRQHQLRATGKIAVPLLPHLFITFGVDLFAVERGGQGWGASYDSTVGIRAHTDAAYQRL